MFVIKRRFSTFLSERNKVFQNACRVFAEKELKPVADLHDKLSKFPNEQIGKLTELGLMGACIDQKYGGKGYDLLSFTLAIEELSRCCASTGIIASIHNCLYANLIQTYGTPDQINEFLIPFTKGKIGVFALSEHDAGSDVANLSTTATECENGYKLNGHKAWVTSAIEGKAGVFFAYTDKSKGHNGITAFIIPLDTAGVQLGPRNEKLGIRAASTCDICLNDVKVSHSNVIGAIGNGFKIAMEQLQLGRIGVAAQAIGIGQAAFDLAIKYSYDRKVFGEKLCDKQLVKSKLAKMAIDLESARLLLWKAAMLRDSNEDFRKLSSMAKFAASCCASSNANLCVQILGAKGYMSGEAERLYRDSRITKIYGGASDIQMLVIADLLLKETKSE
ncbi:short-chain specific acyl-CoA dehydrogenase, mitochondrial-like [Contarinia nasturtii]|uniref:short-chain specific acyl-CoA dehydrogenase, mitochondrial-like n=1 Tax=Contarinia nasturtii TaxID=265458 RepID=UPI0012D3840E|nr:short-chain specific acyl-CoA dehydrogenase, mitochondrial-like [Contarinia nasturtii]